MLLILLLAALLRFYNLSGQSLWADEGNSAALAQQDVTEIARRTAFDIHPPLYYWLLKGWTAVFGASETGLRSLSAVLGIALVYLVGRLGQRFFNRRVGLIAAFIAALSPLQVYYSQEARMYILLALLCTASVLAALVIFENFFIHKKNRAAQVAYLLAATAGLYTHYAYPLILLAVNLTALAAFWQASKRKKKQAGPGWLSGWLVLQVIPFLFYLPWLPVAWRQVTTWPSERQVASWFAILETISTTLFFGLSWPFRLPPLATLGLALILLAGLWLGLKLSSTSSPAPTLPLLLLWLWCLLPVALTVMIFTPAFLKFLLVAAPALALLLALAIEWLLLATPGHRPAGRTSWPGRLAGAAVLLGIASASAIALAHYYTDPAYARDNYRGLASFIQAVGGPKDAVILHAEGQQDVFNYYYQRGLDFPQAGPPVYPLPRQRPLDQAATLAELQRISREASRVYAVYWATRQADPAGLIESWLDTHLFKATDQWFGNVRLVSYAAPRPEAELTWTPADYRLGQHIRLTGYTLASSTVAPGDILEVALAWETTAPAENYTVFVQVLDQANHVVGQRDAAPLVPAPEWPVGQSVVDQHGVVIEPGTPPGRHRLIVGLYHSATGQRLPVSAPATESRVGEGYLPQDFVELSNVEIVRPEVPLPLAAFTMQVRLNTPLREVTLLGYDLYKTGHRSAPDIPLHPGDPVHLVAYWSASQPVQQLEDQLLLQVVTEEGQATPISVTAPPAGTAYPIDEWQPGEIIRAQYDLFLSNLEPGTYRLALTMKTTDQPAGQAVTALTRPFQVK